LAKHNVVLDGHNAGGISMIMATDPFALLRYRRKEIAAETRDLRTQLEALEAEDMELASAEKVISRFGGGEAPDPEPSSPNNGKPVGTPTTPNMILALLKEAIAQGKPGLEPKDMQMTIARRWWPTVKSEDVGPTAWRMWKDGRLSKNGAVYTIKQDDRVTIDDMLGMADNAAERGENENRGG
jgi:hypothetical protein